MLVEVNGCTIGDKKHGETIELEKAQAEHLIKIGYAKEVEQPVKAEPKKPATRKKADK
jgi:hypothetical protein